MRVSLCGVKPPQYKQMTNNAVVGRVDDPGSVGVRIHDCSFAEEVPAVVRGDGVERGQWYRVKGVRGCFLASVSGVYEGAAMLDTPDGSGIPCAVLTAKGAQNQQTPVMQGREDTPDADVLVAIAERAGIVDEVDGLLLSDKLRAWKEIKPYCVVVDADDPQPYSTAGEAALRDAPQEICEGAKLCARACNAERVVVAVSSPWRFSALRERMGASNVVRSDARYPHESVLHGVRPRVIIGPQACLALWRAVRFGLGQTELLITVSGDGVSHPQNVYAPVGCMAETVFRHCGLDEKASLFVLGDALSGIEIEDLLTPVWQDTTCVLALSQAIGAREETHCTRCGLCVPVCHKGLNPCEIMRLYREGLFEELAAYRAELCDGCGCCSFVCPAGCEVSAQVLSAADLGDAFEIEIGGAEDATV